MNFGGKGLEGDKMASKFNSLAYGNVMAAAAENLKKVSVSLVSHIDTHLQQNRSHMYSVPLSIDTLITLTLHTYVFALFCMY